LCRESAKPAGGALGIKAERIEENERSEDNPSDVTGFTPVTPPSLVIGGRAQHAVDVIEQLDLARPRLAGGGAESS